MYWGKTLGSGPNLPSSTEIFWTEITDKTDKCVPSAIKLALLAWQVLCEKDVCSGLQQRHCLSDPIPGLDQLCLCLWGAGPCMDYLWQTTSRPPNDCHSLQYLDQVLECYRMTALQGLAWPNLGSNLGSVYLHLPLRPTSNLTSGTQKPEVLFKAAGVIWCFLTLSAGLKLTSEKRSTTSSISWSVSLQKKWHQ